MPEDFAEEFTGADLKDLRRSRRLPVLAARLADAPAASISAACGGWAESMAAFRLLNNGDFAAEKLIGPQTDRTSERCADHDCVIAIQPPFPRPPVRPNGCFRSLLQKANS